MLKWLDKLFLKFLHEVIYLKLLREIIISNNHGKVFINEYPFKLLLKYTVSIKILNLNPLHISHLKWYSWEGFWFKGDVSMPRHSIFPFSSVLKNKNQANQGDTPESMRRESFSMLASLMVIFSKKTFLKLAHGGIGTKLQVSIVFRLVRGCDINTPADKHPWFLVNI